MIFDTIDSLSTYFSMIPQLKTVEKILLEKDLFAQSAGFHDTTDPLVRYNIIDYTTQNTCNSLEIHCKEADVQIVLEGMETVVSALRDEAQKAGAYDAENDVAFLESDSMMSFVLQKGSFAIFFPGEPHRGNMIYRQPVSCRKVVFKLTMNKEVT